MSIRSVRNRPFKENNCIRFPKCGSLTRFKESEKKVEKVRATAKKLIQERFSDSNVINKHVPPWMKKFFNNNPKKEQEKAVFKEWSDRKNKHKFHIKKSVGSKSYFTEGPFSESVKSNNHTYLVNNSSAKVTDMSINYQEENGNLTVLNPQKQIRIHQDQLSSNNNFDDVKNEAPLQAHNRLKKLADKMISNIKMFNCDEVGEQRPKLPIFSLDQRDNFRVVHPPLFDHLQNYGLLGNSYYAKEDTFSKRKRVAKKLLVHLKKLKSLKIDYFENAQEQVLSTSTYQHQGAEEFIKTVRYGDYIKSREILLQNPHLVYDFDNVEYIINRVREDEQLSYGHV